ncbi:MAG: MFS transporter [Pseudomonadota bacterium]
MPKLSKSWSVFLLLVAEVSAMSLWFVTAAILPEMIRETDISPVRQAAMSSGVQIGFVVGALAFAILGLPDRLDPRRVFAVSAVAAALANLTLLVFAPGSAGAIAARFVTGALLAGVYPVGMKIIVGWGVRDRGFLVGALVGALILGSAAPYLIALLGGADWRVTVIAASVASCLGGLSCLLISLGPHHSTAAAFDPKAILLAWSDRRIRLAYVGYLGHMWELYAMWAWIGAASAATYTITMSDVEAERLARITAFIAIGIGGVLSAVAGIIADRVGKADVAMVAMCISGLAALGTALSFGGPAWLTFGLILIWGLAIAPDSAQFSALVADAAPPEQAGSLLTLQTALGFALTFFTVQLTPVAADAFGWPIVLAIMAIGPGVGVVAMLRLRSLPSQ